MAAPWEAADLIDLATRGSCLPGLSAARLTVTVDGGRADFVSWGFYAITPWRNWRHSHSFYEVCLAYSGRGTFESRGSTIAVQAGDMFVARPGDLHEICSSEDDPLGITFWGFTLPQRTALPAWLDGLVDPDGPVCVDATGGVDLSIRMMVTAVAEGGARADARTEAIARTVLLETAAALDPGPVDHQPPAGNADAAVSVMRRYLEDNLDRPVRVRDVAAQVHLSERHAARLFRDVTGESIRAHLRDLRCAEAASQLLRSGATITGVAASCGFFDRHHLARVFRDRYGMSPADFQRRSGTTFVE